MSARISKDTCEIQDARGHVMLFENPAANYPLGLSWHFNFELEERDESLDFPVSGMGIEWIPFEGSHWREILGLRASLDEPVEATLYDGEHHYISGHAEFVSTGEQTIGGKIRGTAEIIEREVDVDLAFEVEFEGLMIHSALWDPARSDPPKNVREIIASVVGFGSPVLRTNIFGSPAWWLPVE